MKGLGWIALLLVVVGHQLGSGGHRPLRPGGGDFRHALRRNLDAECGGLQPGGSGRAVPGSFVQGNSMPLGARFCDGPIAEC